MDLVDGEITLNGKKATKTLRRKLGYVLQEDVFFSHLTVDETLKVQQNNIIFCHKLQFRNCHGMTC